MQRIFHLGAVAAAGIFLIGCGDNEPEQVQSDQVERVRESAGTPADPEALAQRNPGMADRARESMSNAWQDVSSFSADQKDAFVENLEDGAEEVDGLIASARARLSDLPEDTREARAEAIDELEDARAEFEEALAEAREATGEAWTTARTEVALAWDRLQEEMAEFREDIRD